MIHQYATLDLDKIDAYNALKTVRAMMVQNVTSKHLLAAARAMMIAPWVLQCAVGVSAGSVI